VKVLVTGASGMLGAGVARALAARGDEVTVLQRRPAGLGLREVLADVSDAARVRSAVAGQQAVIHLAAKVNVTGAWADYRRANIIGTEVVVAACQQTDVRRLVHVSTPSVAHAGSSLIGAGADRADPGSARGRYARSKAVAEQIALRADGGQLSVVAVRPHLVWGPGDPQLIGRIVERGRTGRLPRIGSGAALVDTTYATNAVDALLAALDRCPAARGQALVVSNGEPRPIAELLTAICQAAGVPDFRYCLPKGLALAAGAAAQSLWPLRTRLLQQQNEADPPITRFLVEQMSTPRVSLDQGFAELTGWYRDRSVP
jgi:2-alkyl-3-oxoalkanoate reductase